MDRIKNVLKIGQEVAVLDERAIFVIELVAIDAFFEERPIAGSHARLVVVDGLDEIDQGLAAEVTVCVGKDTLLKEHGRDVVTLRQVDHFIGTDGQTGRFGLRDEDFVVENRLPGSIAKLGVLRFRAGVLAQGLGDLGIVVQFFVELPV